MDYIASSVFYCLLSSSLPPFSLSLSLSSLSRSLSSPHPYPPSMHSSGRNLVSRHEELMWSSPPLGSVSFWLCPSTLLFCTFTELVLCIQIDTWLAEIYYLCFISHICVYTLHIETWFTFPCHRKCHPTY